MINIEKIANGYIIEFENTEKAKIKLYFEKYDEMSAWIKSQIDITATTTGDAQ